MTFYLNPKGYSVQEYMAKYGEFIGTLGNKQNPDISRDDISIERINSNLKQGRFLACLIFNRAWWVCVLFNNSQGAKQIKQKYMKMAKYWYWLGREYVEYCLPSMQLKSFRAMFPELKSEQDKIKDK